MFAGTLLRIRGRKCNVAVPFISPRINLFCTCLDPRISLLSELLLKIPTFCLLESCICSFLIHLCIFSFAMKVRLSDTSSKRTVAPSTRSNPYLIDKRVTDIAARPILPTYAWQTFQHLDISNCTRCYYCLNKRERERIYLSIIKDDRLFVGIYVSSRWYFSESLKRPSAAVYAVRTDSFACLRLVDDTAEKFGTECRIRAGGRSLFSTCQRKGYCQRQMDVEMGNTCCIPRRECIYVCMYMSRGGFCAYYPRGRDNAEFFSFFFEEEALRASWKNEVWGLMKCNTQRRDY